MAVELSSQDSGKENRYYYSSSSAPSGGKNRTPLGPATNVLNPRFLNFPDPLRCNPYEGEQFHDVVARDPDHAAWPTRADSQFPNPRLPSSTDQKPPLEPVNPMPPQQSAVGIALSPIRVERVDTNDVPAILVTDVDKVGMDREEDGNEPIVTEQPDEVEIDPDSHPRPDTRDSDTSSTRSAVFRAQAVWNARNSLTKSHSIMGINIAHNNDKDGDEQNQQDTNLVYRSQPLSDLSSPDTELSTKVQVFRQEGDAPNSKVPSCVGLPAGWDNVHDRCIAYLSTHAPLTSSGKIPPNEIAVERYTTEEISEFLVTRFPIFHRHKKIPYWAIEKRLQILDIRENEYFKVPYGGYRFEHWGLDV